MNDRKDGQPCRRCEVRYPARVLEYHHRDKTTKLFGIARGFSRSLVQLEAEIAKCDLLCANCHRLEE